VAVQSRWRDLIVMPSSTNCTISDPNLNIGHRLPMDLGLSDKVAFFDTDSFNLDNNS
jgi:hypothetical protein